MMWKFLESEKKVILGLSEDANRTDSEIADIYGLRKGTVATIRRRLVDSGAVFYVNVPAFNKLGCEMIGFHVGTAEPSERADVRANDYLEFCNLCPQVFEGMVGGNSVILFTAFKSVTEYELFMQTHSQFFTGSRHASKARLHGTQFPFSMSRGTYVPNFAWTVYEFFKLEVPAPKARIPIRADVVTPDFSKTERTVLVAMVENPLASDREIASAVKLSRQAVTRIRNKFVEEAIVTKVCIPRLYKWGFEICAIAQVKFNMELSWEKRLKMQPGDVVNRSFLSLSKGDEGVASYLIPNFSGYSEALDNMMAWYHKVNAFDEKPIITLFPLERAVELRNFDYGPAVRNLLQSAGGRGNL
jgi:DNA-binding Lrp family transcriptional regulator